MKGKRRSAVLRKSILGVLAAFTSAFIFPAFSSCSNVAPNIDVIQDTVVFDFPDSKSTPSMRLSVFVQTAADERKVDSVRLVHDASGLEWVCNSPRKVGETEKTVWAGYTNFVPATGSSIPLGLYTFHYVDMAGEESQSQFRVSYPESILKCTPENILSEIRNYDELVAVYDADGILLYLGPRLENWSGDGDIKKSYGLAEKIRVCYRMEGGSVICMMPPKDL